MKTYEEIFMKVKEEIGNQLRFYVDETSDVGVLILPLKDNMGDNFVVRLRQNDTHLILDDAGMTQNTVFVMRETVGGLRGSRLVSGLVKSFDARFDRVEGLVELVSGYDEVVSMLFHFMKLLVTIDTMLVQIEKEEKQEVRPYRQTLGPRASHKIRRSIKPLIQLKKVNHRVTVSGLTVPDWLVDFAYEPVLERLALEMEMVILISVDLAVLDPVVKPSYAYSRAMDIKAAHAKYDIRVAFDRHGQNSSSLNAAHFLTEHQIDSKAYTAIDISEQPRFGELVNLINRETGMKLTT